MEKQNAINLLGGTAKKAAEAMGYTSPHAVYMWPDVLSPEVAQRVAGVVSMLKSTRRKAHADKAAA